MPNRTLRVVAAALLLFGASTASPGRANQTVQCRVTRASQTVCRISEPNVGAKATLYPEVPLQTGDRVVVEAGGCAQSGGIGSTWKRYVKPIPASDHKYFGTISIPGATNGIVPIANIIGNPLTVGADVGQGLILGYVDDDYTDNGYNDHDDGNDDQCKNSVNAFVQLTIDHPAGTSASCGGNTGAKPLDLVWTDCDQNGFPLNPSWRYQVNHSGALPPPSTDLCPSGPFDPANQNSAYGILFYPTCTSWQLTYDWGYWCGPHDNFFAATYVAPLTWDSKSTAGTDDDYNHRVFPANNNGLIKHGDLSTNGIEIEYDSDETIDQFTSPLWKQFHSLVDANNATALTKMNNKTGVVVGLFGFDCGHPDCDSEMHPAYAMALDMDDSNLGNDSWAVFARNWGDEGFCSSNEQNLPITDLQLLIPWRPGATSVTVLPDTQFSWFTSGSGSQGAVASPQVTTVAGRGVLIDFTLPDASQQKGVDGEIYLKWTFPAVLRRTLVARPRPVYPVHQPEADKPEARIGALVARMTSPQRAVFEAHFRSAEVGRVAVSGARLPTRPAHTARVLPPPRRLRTPLAPIAVHDARLVQRSERTRVALCAAYENKLPGFPLACGASPRAVKR